KFANGAVTGAYVMMFNHLRGEIEDRRFKRRNWLIATLIRNNPFSWTWGAEAIFGDIGFQILGAEQDVGLVFILAGEQKGQLFTYHEYVEKFGISVDANFPGAEIGRIDVFGIKSSEFKVEMMIVEYRKAWFSAPIAGASFSWASPGEGITIISTAFTIGIGGGLIKGFGGGFNIGNFRLLND
ncbi:MAG: hypothetical protein ACOCVN_03105, partial [bacterium]